jgi:hypothetical protein
VDTEAQPMSANGTAELHQALEVAVRALDERAALFQVILDDPNVLGVADPDDLRGQVEVDSAASTVLRGLLDG